ncbi:MAG: ComEC/Rec2 family competence protein [Clostridia bacterium]
MKKIANFRYLPAIALMVIAGILLVSYGNIYFSLSVAVATLILIICFCAFPQLRKMRAKAAILLLGFVLSSISTVVVFWSYAQKETRVDGAQIVARVSSANACDINGLVANEINASGNIALVLDARTINGERQRGKITLTIGAIMAKNLKVGSEISVRADMSKIPLNLTESNQKQFNNKYYWRANCRDGDESSFVITSEKINVFDNIKIKTRHFLLSNVQPETADFLFAMTFGDVQYLGDDITSNFRATGTAHLFAVSGLHVGILAGGLLLILRKCKLNNKVIWLIECVFLFGYSFLCGFAPSTLRASFMLLLLQGAKCIGRRNDAFSTISLSAIIILLVKPTALFDVGFQLSYGAVLGILFLSPQIARVLSKILPKKVADLLGVSLAVNIGFLPMAMVYFGNVSMVFVLANLVVIPLISLFYPLYFLALVVTLCLPMAQVVLYFISFPFVAIIKFVELCANIPLFVFKVPMERWMFLPWLGGMFLLSKYSFVNKSAKGATAITLTVLMLVNSVLLVGGWSVDSGKSNVYFYDDTYGNQYALIKSHKYGNYLLVGGGVSYDGMRNTENMLADYAVKHLDGVVKAVVRQDDIQLFSLGNFPQVDNVYCEQFPAQMPDQTPEQSWGVLSSSVINKGASVAIFSAKEFVFAIDGVQICFLAGNKTLPSASDFDIIVTNNADIQVKSGQIVVCGRGYRESKKNFMPSEFTFATKNGIMSREPFWRRYEGA